MSDKGAARAAALERIKSEPGLLRNTIMTIALLVLATTVGLIILGHQRFIAPWENRQIIYGTFAAAPGISPGNGQEIRIHGVIVGDIVAATTDVDGNAVVKMSIDGKYPVYDNAALLMRPKSPLNEVYIEMNPGAPPGRKLADGDVLPLGQSERPIQIDEILSHVDGNVQQALTSLLAESDVALVNARTTLPPGLDATRMVANNLRPVSEQLTQRKELIRRLITALGQISQAVGGDDQRVRSLAASVQTTLRSFGGHSAQIDQSLAALPGVVDQLGRSSTEVRALSEELDPALRNLQSASNDLPKALKALRNTTDKLDDVVDAAGPFLDKAKPVLKDLRPTLKELKQAVPALHDSTKHIDPVTAAVMPYLNDLAAFAVQTRSVWSTVGANGGITRGHLDTGSTDEIPNGPLGPNQGIKPIPLPLPGPK